MPPVHSPLGWGALWRGFRAMTSRGEYERALAEIDDWMRRTYDPASWVWTDSGTTALTLALKLAAEQTGSRRVALPAYGCFDLATAADGAESEVVLYDLDPTTLGPDWPSLERAVAAGARTIVVAHLYGVPVDMDRARSLARETGVVLVEDAAQAIGATFGGRPCGSMGELSVLSFGRGKGVTAGGGGALLAFGERWRKENHRLDDRQGPGGGGAMALLKSAVQCLLARPSLYRLPASLPFLGLGETIYRPPQPARAMSRSATGILAETVRLSGSELEHRRGHAARLLQFAGDGAQIAALKVVPGAEPGWLRLPLVIGVGRKAGWASGSASVLGIMPGYPGVLGALPRFGSRVVNAGERWPGAARLVERLITLPTHGRLAEGDMHQLEARLRGDTTS